MSLRIRRFDEADAAQWDGLCARSHQATFLHTRLFLSYHGDRFEDLSLVIEEEGRWLGVFPAARNPVAHDEIVSHPGLSYGGVVHAGELRGDRMIQALRGICAHYLASGFTRILYKAVPHIYHRTPSQDDLYALFRMRGARIRCDLSCTLDLHEEPQLGSQRRRGLKLARQSRLRVVAGESYAAALWEVLTENLHTKFSTRPVHTLDEILLLSARFPQNIRFVCGLLEERVVAGVVLFVTPAVTHAQYIAASSEGKKINALDAVFSACIHEAIAGGQRWFDFGISNENAGEHLNNGLYHFKSTFGGGGVVHEFFELSTSEVAHDEY